MDEKFMRREIGRRRLLRRAGAVAAGVAGAGAVAAAVATPAQAASGDNLVLGSSTNSAGTAATTLTTNSSANPTLVLSNSAVTTDSKGFSVGGPALQLAPSGDYTGGPVGSVGMATDGTLWYRRDDLVTHTGPFSDPVRTGSNSTIVTAFAPVRMLDTRPGQPAVNRILNPGVIDGNGFVRQGQILQLSLDDLLKFGYSVFLNVTLLTGNGPQGYITLFPTGAPQPLASNITFGANQIVANFALVGVGSVPGVAVNAISIFCGYPTRVIIDISGAVVNYDDDVKPIAGFHGILPSAVPKRQRPANL
jgi:hypothetical protein